MNSERTFKCRICGGEVTWEKGSSMGECIYCGSKQPIPSNLTAHTQDLYNDAFEYLKKNEYDKAFVVYENIIKENPTDAEAYWGRGLCRYGIEYVDDPNTGKKIPTCHRLQAKSILKDEDYLSALKFAPDEATKSLYTMRATTIDVIQRDIISISQGEEGKYDIFISFKDTDNNDNRTKDSHLAEEIYNELTKQGYKVFFSRVTLAQKLGAVYEPYIYAAIHSAKIMIVVGTKPEYIESAWVRNEWSRYLDLIREGNDKKLIVCFKDMSRKALPEEFVPFQNLDMNERGSMVALVQNIGKIVKPTKKEVKKPTPKKAKKRGCSGCLIPILIVLGIIGAIIYFAREPIQNLWQQMLEEAGIVVETPSNGVDDSQKPADDALYYNDLQYEEYGAGVRIIGYRGTSDNVVIPEKIDGMSVVAIARLAFYNCTSIHYLTVPNSVTLIEDSAFCGCNSIEEITLPFVGQSAATNGKQDAVFGYIFGDTTPNEAGISRRGSEGGAENYKTSDSADVTVQLIDGTSYYQYVIPKTIRKVVITNQKIIPQNAFRNCDLLCEIVVDQVIDMIGSQAFENCSSISTFHYGGTQQMWDEIEFGSDWNKNANDFSIVYNKQ